MGPEPPTNTLWPERAIAPLMLVDTDADEGSAMDSGSQTTVAGCPELRAALVRAKKRRNDAILAATQADIEARPRPGSAADLVAARLAVDVAAVEARRSGCDVDDLVGRDVGHFS
jgi:hypothetical protein